jgi:IS30 family transposase
MSYEKGNTKLQESEHLNYEERKTIERQLKAGVSKKGIARLLVRDLSTIKREIKRGAIKQRKRNPYQGKKIDYKEFIEYEVYSANTGQRVYEKNRHNCGARNKIIKCKKLVEFVESKILSPEKWSPDASIGYAKANGMFEDTVSTKTFYNWIDDGLTKVKNIDLLLKVRRKPNSPRRERKKILGKSIDDRPKEIETREEFGHWEGDGIVGKGHKGHIITLVERKLGIGLMWNVLDRKEDRILAVLDELKEQLSSHFSVIFKSITFDNGSEFSASYEMEKLNGPAVYYAHPYSSWERAINENWNGLVRRFLPKGKSFDDLTDADIKRIMHYINTLPRKRLGYKTPLALWNSQLEAIMSA